MSVFAYCLQCNALMMLNVKTDKYSQFSLSLCNTELKKRFNIRQNLRKKAKFENSILWT